MSKYTPATFQPVIRPDWGGVMSYLPVEEKALILEALIKYPSVECESRFWLETIKPDLDVQYETFIRQCEAKSRAVRDRWAKTSITPLKDMNKTSNRGGIVSESESEREREIEKEKEWGIVKGGEIEAINSVLKKFNLPEVKKLTPARKIKLSARVKDCGGFAEFLGQMEVALAGSSFLRGENDRGWRADFDFFLQESKWIKATEGGFADKTKTNEPDFSWLQGVK